MNFLFDLYGTLVDIKTDEEKAQLWQSFAKLLGENDGEEIKTEYLALCKKYSDCRAHQFVEFDLLRVFEDMLRKRGVDIEKAREFARSFRILSREKLNLFPCAIEILQGLKKKGEGVYLVSNAQACFTLDELEELGLTELFDGILISSDAGIKKPSEEIFYKALTLFNINGQENYYVGNDMRDDVLGAHNSGLKTVYIETEQSGRYPSVKLPCPNIVAKDHRELKELLFDIVSA